MSNHDKSTKKILLIGVTGNGKSRFIKEALLYAGDNAKAAGVRVGDGSLSETQSCSIYSLRVPLRVHSLKNVQTCITVEPTRDIERNEVVEASRDLGRSLELQIIDSPGLNDSQNRSETALDLHCGAGDTKSQDSDVDGAVAQMQSKLQRMKEKDERHKIKILRALFEAKSIHGICFVIKQSAGFSSEFQRAIRSLLSIFNMAFQNLPHGINYHILHTHVNESHRYSGWPQKRERAFKEKFYEVNATHHFLDNNPPKSSPVAGYFAKAALAKLFLSLVDAMEMEVQNLWYPKQDAHVDNDRRLREGFSDLERVLRKEVGDYQKKRDHKAQMLSCLQRDLKVEVDALRRKQEEIIKWNPDKRVYSNSRFVSKDSGWVEYAKTGITVKSAWPISKPVVYSEIANGVWEDKVEESHTVSATMRSTSGWSITGKITVYSLKKHKEKEEFDRLHEQQTSIGLRKGELTREIIQLKCEIGILKSSIISCETTIANLVLDRKKISNRRSTIERQYLSVDKLSDTLMYFTADSIYSTALGYKLTCRIPKTKLPQSGTFTPGESTVKSESVTTTSIISSISLHRARIQTQIKTIKRNLNMMKSELKRKTTLEQSLAAMSQHIAELLDQQEKLLNETDHIVFSSHNDEACRSVGHSPSSVEIALNRAKSELKKRSRNATDMVRATAEERVYALTRHAQALCGAKEIVEGVVKTLEAKRDGWLFQQKRLRLWNLAADEVIKMVGEPDLNIGAFLVVRKALWENRTLEATYLILCNEVWKSKIAKELL